MAKVAINGTGDLRMPIVRLDGKDYFILGGSYQRKRNEKVITDRYTKDGEIDRQKQNTEKTRWKFTLVVPASTSYITTILQAGESFDFGDMTTLLASDDKVWPYDGLYFYDVTVNEDFSGSYTSYVYMFMDWESPMNNDIGIWQVPVELWGRNV